MILTEAGDFPVFVVEPMDTVATPTGNLLTATLHCKSDSKIKIKWYKDDVTIEKALFPSCYNTTNTSLMVATALSDTDKDCSKLDGLYSCVISNTLGSVRSRSALVTSQYHLHIAI